MKIFKNPLFVLLVILAVYCAAIFYAKNIVEFIYGNISEEPSKTILTNTGLFGDSAGAINALFSALAFFGVLWTLIVQREDSKEQREKVKKEMFESTFFQMMSLQQEIVNDLNISYQDNGTEKQKTGRQTFQFTYYEYELDYNNSKCTGMGGLIKTHGKEIYNTIILPSNFDHYFRHLYRIIKFVDKTDLLPDNFEIKYQYTSMVRAQLSRFELIWMFYNCLSKVGFDEFKPLVEKYSLLKNIRPDFLAEKSDIDLYKEKMRKDYQEIPNADFNKEYKHSAFVKTPPPSKKIRFTVPKILDININIKYARSIMSED